MAASGDLVYLGLGSNLGDPSLNIRRAISEIESLGVTSLNTSSLWRSEPVGFDEPVPEFVNAVVRFATRLSAVELLERLQAIERKFGRKGGSNGYAPRILDLDVIDFGGQIVDEAGLTLPHPRAAERLFVLLPLQELSREFRFPDRHESLEALVSQAPQIEIARIKG